MDHVAIMKKEWKFIDKILDGSKTIESRWYEAKRAPWGRIHKEDTIYFKNSGEVVSAKARVKKILQFSCLTPDVKHILGVYGMDIGIDKKEAAEFFKKFRDKKYCILIFLKNPRKVKPFQISKKGFGAMASWISLKNINHIKI